VGCSICWALSRRISEDWFNYFPLFVHVFVLLPASFSAFQRTGDEVLTMALAHGPAEQGCEVAKGVRVNGLDSCLPEEKHILSGGRIACGSKQCCHWFLLLYLHRKQGFSSHFLLVVSPITIVIRAFTPEYIKFVSSAISGYFEASYRSGV
jgi:hypothetical protein